MESETPVTQGTYLSLRITLTKHDEPLVVPVAQVRWVNGHTLGIVFIRVSADCQRPLRHYLATISVRGQSER